MQRGRQIFDKLNYDSSEILKHGSKGRSKILIKERNQCICLRYWYHSKRHKRRYDEVLKLLSKEFYLSERTIVDVVSENANLIKNVYKENPIINRLKIEFEHLTWK
jgi:hypothetical protein